MAVELRGVLLDAATGVGAPLVSVDGREGWIGGVPWLMLWRHPRSYAIPGGRFALAALLRAGDGDATACKAAAAALATQFPQAGGADGPNPLDGVPQAVREAVLDAIRPPLAPLLAAAAVLRRAAEPAGGSAQSKQAGSSLPMAPAAEPVEATGCFGGLFGGRRGRDPARVSPAPPGGTPPVAASSAAVNQARSTLTLPVVSRRAAAAAPSIASAGGGAAAFTGSLAEMLVRLARGCAAVVDAALLGADAAASAAAFATLIAAIDAGTLSAAPPPGAPLGSSDTGPFLAHPVIQRVRALAAGQPPFVTCGGNAPSAAAAAALAILEGVLDAAGIASVGDVALLRQSRPQQAAAAAAPAPRTVPAPLRQQLRATLPPAVLAAARCPRLSAALGGVLSASWRGDAVAAPPAGGVYPGFAAALLDALGLGAAVLREPGGGARGADEVTSVVATTSDQLPFWRLAPVLDAPTLAMLLHAPLLAALDAVRAQRATAGGRGSAAAASPAAGQRLSVTVCRQRPAAGGVSVPSADTSYGALGELARQLKAAGALQASAAASAGGGGGGTARVLHPSFESAALGGGAGAAGSTEDGEGQGPRKEVFQMAASDAACEWAPYVPGPGSVTITPGSNRIVVSVVTQLMMGGVAGVAGVAQAVRELPGSQLRVRLAGGGGGAPARPPAGKGGAINVGSGSSPGVVYEAVVVQADRAEVDGVWTLHVDVPAPPTCAPAASAPYEVAARAPPLLAFRKEAALHWPAATTVPGAGGDGAAALRPGAAAAYAALGWAVGAALVNRCTLPLSLPPLLLALMLAPAAAGGGRGSALGAHDDAAAAPPLLTLHALAALDPALLDSAVVGGAYRLDAGAFQGLLDGEGLSPWQGPDGAVALLEADDARRERGEWTPLPPAHPAVRDAYVARLLVEVTAGAAAPHTAALRAGLQAALGAAGMQCLASQCGVGPAELALVACGGGGGSAGDPLAPRDLRKVFRVVWDEELQACEPLREALWAAVNTWSAPQQRRFLQFVTGVAAFPAPGTELLRIEAPFAGFGAEQIRRAADRLPQAHTCSNTLELPNYYAALKAGQPAPPSANAEADLVAAVRAHLAAKLALAVEATEGYGLDTNEGFGGGGSGGRGAASRATPAATTATVRGGGGGGSALGPLPLISPAQSALAGGGGGDRTASRAAAASVLDDEDAVTGVAAGGGLRSEARGSALSLGAGSRAVSMQRMVPAAGGGGGRGSSGVVLPSALLDLSDEEDEEEAAVVATRRGRQQAQGLPGSTKPLGIGAQQLAPRFTAAAGGRTVPSSSTAPLPTGAPAPAGSLALHTLASRADTPPLAAGGSGSLPSGPLQRTPSVSPSSNSMDDLEAELARAVGQQQRQQQGRAPAGGVAGPARAPPGASGFGITVSQRGITQPQQRPPQNARATGSIVHGPGIQLAGAAGLGPPGASDDLLDLSLSLEAPPASVDLRRPPVPSFTGSSRASAAAAVSLSRTPSSSQLGTAGAPPSARAGTPTPSAAASQSRRHAAAAAAADQPASGSTGFAAPLRAAPSSKGLGGGGSFSVGGGSGSGGSLVGRTPVKARLVPDPPEDAPAGVVRIGDGPADDLDDLF